MFGSAQCLGYRMEHGQLTNDLCFPPEATVMKQIKRAVKSTKAKAIFVATDNDAMISKIQKYLKNSKVRVQIFIKLNFCICFDRGLHLLSKEIIPLSIIVFDNI